MKKILTAALSIFMIAALVGCGQSGNTAATKESTSNPSSVQESVESTLSIENSEDSKNGQTDENADNSADIESDNKILVAYFSLAGEQYNVGVIEEGNTAIVAKMIAEETGADLFEIEPVNAYPSSHSELLTVAQNEQRDNARPEFIRRTSPETELGGDFCK